MTNVHKCSNPGFEMKLHSKLEGALGANGIFRLVEHPSGSKEEIGLEEGIERAGLKQLCSPLFGTVKIPEELAYLSYGDIVKIRSDSSIAVLYRNISPHNSIFITERCNSRCLMCSQPPREIDDSYLIEDWLQAIPLMSPETKELGITGGEPTLHFSGLMSVIESAGRHLPGTALHLLSNGRSFANLTSASLLASRMHPNLTLGIPLYSDVEEVHDFVVQAKGAYTETVLGLLNLARCGQRIELRVVIHRHTFDRLPELARFIGRNLPFVEHVALMGLEVMGYAKSNFEALWMHPREFSSQLKQAVWELAWAGIDASIYNLPLCLLPEELWPFTQKSISDWKNEYLPDCEVCRAKPDCGGFFTSALFAYRDVIQPISDARSIAKGAI